MRLEADLYPGVAVVLLVLVTVGTRSFFLLPDREPRLPGWLRQGLRHAPVAALLAMVAPELPAIHAGAAPAWHDARFLAVGAALAWFAWRRDDITGTILAGTGTLMVLRIGFGWA